jgi:DNA primase
VATTYKFYVDMARVLMYVHKGKALDLIRAPEFSVSSFIERLRPVDREELVELVELDEKDGDVAA